jgi:thioredoxin 1
MDELEEIRAKKLESYWNDMNPPTVTLEKKMPGSPIEVSDENFSSILSEYDLLIVDCWAPWCGPCRMLSPTIEELAKIYEGKVVFGKLNTDNNRGVAGQFGIMSIPTLLFFKNGKLVGKEIGAVPRKVIESNMRKYF